jgi:hypothetical protein
LSNIAAYGAVIERNYNVSIFAKSFLAVLMWDMAWSMVYFNAAKKPT